MTITPEQLKALELAHDAVRAAQNKLAKYYLETLGGLQPENIVSGPLAESDTALDTLTAAIENLKEGTK